MVIPKKGMKMSLERNRITIQAECREAVGHRYMPIEFVQACLDQPDRETSAVLDDALPRRLVATDPDFSDEDMLEMFEDRRSEHSPGFRMPETRVTLQAGTWRELGVTLQAVPFDQYDEAFGLLTVETRLSGERVIIEFCT